MRVERSVLHRLLKGPGTTLDASPTGTSTGVSVGPPARRITAEGAWVEDTCAAGRRSLCARPSPPEFGVAGLRPPPFRSAEAHGSPFLSKFRPVETCPLGPSWGTGRYESRNPKDKERNRDPHRTRVLESPLTKLVTRVIPSAGSPPYLQTQDRYRRVETEARSQRGTPSARCRHRGQPDKR